MIHRRPIFVLLLALPVLAAACDDDASEQESDTRIDSIKAEIARGEGAKFDTTAPRPPVDSTELASAPSRLLRPDEVAWGEIGRWSGTGDKGTERFQVASDEWRLVGTVEPLNGAEESWVVVKIFDADREHLHTFSIEAAGTDTGYVHVEPGVYYMTIGTKEARWRLLAEERRLPAEQVRPPQ